MKKEIKKTGLLAVLFLLVLGMAGCQENGEPTKTDNPTVETKKPSIDVPTKTDNPTVETTKPTVEEDEATKLHTVAEILELCEKNDGKRYLVKGTITKILNPMYGEMEIEDETGKLYIYGTYDKDGNKQYPDLEDKPVVGDEVVLSGLAQTYKDKKELKSAWIQSVKHNAPVFNEADYKAMSIKEARAAAIDSKVKLTGVVARITYASGKKPSGLILVDGTESIYIYDMMIASEAKIGNKLTVCGTRDSWINADEAYNAEKFGYKGCTQLSHCHSISLDKSVTDIDYSWVKENTIKNIIENNPENDITSTIFKVNGLITKSVNPGFTNYIIDDVDGKTGSYVYTQCNGADFTWLDEFDGKICTIYLSALNAKATSAGLQYRFLPISVKDENYQFDLATGAQFAIDYFAKDQFGSSYMLNPNLELAQSVSYEHLGLNDVKLSYESSNNEALSFVLEDGKLFMRTTNTADSKVDVTITAAHGENTASTTITINVYKTPEIASTNVKGAIDAKVGDKVTVRGTVGASLVNRDGFYLIDETGVIAVTTTKDVLSQIKLHNEVIITATKALIGKSSSDIEFHYQLALKDASLDLNLYGDEPYSMTSFKEMTLEEAKNLDVNAHENTELGITVSDVTVEFTGGGYSTNVFLCSGDCKMMLYASGSKQYKWLEAYNGKTIKVDLAVCNWNSAKGGYKATVLAVYNGDGTKTYNTLNFSK